MRGARILLSCLATIGCSDPECTPVSETPLEPGGSEPSRTALLQAVTDFVTWSDHDVCVTSLSVSVEWDPDSSTIEVEDDPQRVRSQAFYDLCWLGDPDGSFGFDHPLAFTGEAVNESDHLRRVKEDFSRSCVDAASWGPWLEAALQSCDEPLSARSEALLSFFDTPSAGYVLQPWESEVLGSLPPFDPYASVLVGDLLVTRALDYGRATFEAFALPSLERRWSVTLPAGDYRLFQGLDTALVHDRASGAIFELTEDGAIPGVPVPPEHAWGFAQDDRTWWFLDGEGGLYTYNPSSGTEHVADQTLQIASGDPLWVRTHDGTTAGGSYHEALVRSSDRHGRPAFLGGRHYTFIEAWPHLFTVRHDPDREVLVDTWCHGAQEWTQPQRHYYANRNWLLEARYTSYFWSGVVSDMEVVLLR